MTDCELEAIKHLINSIKDTDGDYQVTDVLCERLGDEYCVAAVIEVEEDEIIHYAKIYTE